MIKKLVKKVIKKIVEIIYDEPKKVRNYIIFFGMLSFLLFYNEYLEGKAITKETYQESDIGALVYNEEIKKEKPSPKKKNKKYIKVRVTYYHPVKSQCDDTPGITADNSRIDLRKLKQKKLKWIAVSRDLLPEYKYGDRILLETGDNNIDGLYEIHDTMNPRFHYAIDILVHPDNKMEKGNWIGKITKTL